MQKEKLIIKKNPNHKFLYKFVPKSCTYPHYTEALNPTEPLSVDSTTETYRSVGSALHTTGASQEKSLLLSNLSSALEHPQVPKPCGQPIPSKSSL